jgi:hypothetical protein
MMIFGGLLSGFRLTLGFALVAELFLSAGCAKAIRKNAVSIQEACGVDPIVWKQIPTPSQREGLFDLLRAQSEGNIVRYFTTDVYLRESWFEHSDRTVLVCRYKQQAPCGGGIASTVVFRSSSVAWEAGPILTRICSD